MQMLQLFRFPTIPLTSPWASSNKPAQTCIYQEDLKKKKMHVHKTKMANTNTSKTKQNTKKKYVSKEIKLRFLSQIIELADKYIAKEHLAAIMDTRLQTFERIRLEMPSLRSVRSSEWATKPRAPTSIVNNEGDQLVIEVIWSISCK